MASRFPSGLGTATNTLHHPAPPDLDSPMQPPAKHGSKAHLLKAAVQSLKGQTAQGASDDEGTGRAGDHAAEASRVGRSRQQGSRQPKKLRQHICLDSEERERCRRVWEDFREEKGLAYVSVSNEDGLLRTDHVSYAQELLARLGQHPLSEDTVRSLLSGTKFTATHQHALTLDELCQVMGRIKRRVHKQKKDPVDVITRVLGTHADSLLCPSPLSTERIYKDVHRRHQQRDAEQRATSAAGASATAAAAATASCGVDGDGDAKSPRCGEGLVGKELASAGAVRLAFSDAMFAAGKRKPTPAVTPLARPPSFYDASPSPPPPAAAVSPTGLLAADAAAAPQTPALSSAPASAHAPPLAPDTPARPPLRHPCDPRRGPPQACSSGGDGRRLQTQTLARVQAATRRQAARLEAARAKREGLQAAHALLREVAAEGVAKIRQVVGVVNAAAESAERAESAVVTAAAVGQEPAVRSGDGSGRLVVARRSRAGTGVEEDGDDEEEEEALRRVIAAQVAALGKQSASGTALIKSVDALDATLQSKWRRFYKDDLQYRERVGGRSPRRTQQLRRKPVPPPLSKGSSGRATHGSSAAAPTVLRRSASRSCLVATAGTALTSTTEADNPCGTLRVTDAALCATQGEEDSGRLMGRYTQTGIQERPRNMAPRSGRNPVRQYAYLRGA